MEDLRTTLDSLESGLANLKQQYDLFFQGTRRGEPSKERKEFETRILVLSRRSIINLTDQQRFSNLTGKFWTFSNLWTRTVRDLEEGRLRRDETGAVTRKGIGKPYPAPGEDGAADIERAARELMEARRSCGIGAGEEELPSLRETLQARAKEISASAGGKKVEFHISVEEGKPKVKATLS